MTTEKFFPYARQSIEKGDLADLEEVFSGSIITRGPFVERFEQEVAQYCGAKYGVAFDSGTAALFAACHAGQVNSFDRVISTPNTFVATVGAGTQYHATPVFIDIDRSTGNMDLGQLEQELSNHPTSRGKPVVMPVHFAGIPVDMQQLDLCVKDPNAVVIEDAAHALGSSYLDGQKVGCCAWSHMTIFSFHPAKTITTGEGGMVMTNDDELCHRLRRYRNNGIERDQPHLEGKAAPWYYEVQEITGNFNFTDFQAAVGLKQLARLDKFAAKRRQLVACYRERLNNIPGLQMLKPASDALVAFHIFVVQIDYPAFKTTRLELVEKLRTKGIGTQVHYIPVYRHPVYRRMCGDLSSYFPQMEQYYQQALTLPLYYDLNEEDVDYICKTLKEILKV